TIDTDGARVLFPGSGWGLVRASNTNPYLTLRFEAHTDAEIEAMKRVIYDRLRRAAMRSRAARSMRPRPGASRARPSAAGVAVRDQRSARIRRTAARTSGARGQSRSPHNPAGSSRIASSPAARAPRTYTEYRSPT